MQCVAQGLMVLVFALTVAAILTTQARGDDGSLARAMEAFEAGDLETARHLADQALAAGGLNEPGEGRAYFYQAEGRFYSGQLETVLSDFAQVEWRIGTNIHTATGRR